MIVDVLNKWNENKKCECKTVNAQEKIVKVFVSHSQQRNYEEIGEQLFGAMKK